MNKDNIFRSSSFFMAVGDILHMLIIDEHNTTVDIELGGVETEDVVPSAVVALPATDIISGGFTANWGFIENAEGYYFSLATDSDMTPHVSGYDKLDVGNVNTIDITGLTTGRTYYYQIIAYNEVGEGVGSNIISTPLPVITVTDIDGNIYTTVIIGTQEWMVQNLRTLHYADNSPIPNVTDTALWQADTTGAYCWYDNIDPYDPSDPSPDLSMLDYGALYNWYAVNHGNVVAGADLAPTGWKVPSNADINILIAYLGGITSAGGKLKEVGLSHWLTPNEGATDAYGFKSLPGGARRFQDGLFGALSTIAAYGTQEGWNFGNAYDSAEGTLNDTSPFKMTGLSIRCMRDLTVGTTYATYTDGTTTFRKGVRDHAFVVDVALTALAFSGVEDVDWKNLKTTP